MKYCSYFLLISALLLSCKKWDDFRQLVPNGEIRYPGIDSAVIGGPGKNRIQLTWHPTPDASVKYYMIYWNSMLDSMKIMAKSSNPKDTQQALISNLPEGAYTITVYAFDGAGYRSMPREVTNARTYGDMYLKNLYNRSLMASKPWEYVDAAAVRLYFNRPDSVNITTEIKYTDQQDQLQLTYIPPSDTSITLANIKPNSWVSRRSSFVPIRTAIDTFYVSRYDSVFIAQ